MPDEAGPYAIREPFPLAPHVTRAREFESLAAEFARQLAGVDAGLAGAAGSIAPLADRSLDAAFDADVLPAVGGLVELGAPLDAGALAHFDAVADSTIAELARQANELPRAGEAPPGGETPATPDPGDTPGLD